MVMLTYAVTDGLMNLKGKEKDKEYKGLSTMILKGVKGQCKTQGEAYIQHP
ncbi:hypothetical protein [Clostridium polynesiense]|uniref:hypothetical protein n=1 Tax=Clostridium polynesiense TaxID=1325933 RepID=UPI000A514049|nr:hypothetical protein [Clostridium polynesiense]